MDSFIFKDQYNTDVSYKAEISAGLQTKGDLLEELYNKLKFPDYFGGNWDALDECIKDLTWLPGGDVIISHKDVPLSSNKVELKTYLGILSDTVEKWNEKGIRKLIVLFPQQFEDSIRKALK